jgi:hypothetical protein
MSNYNLYAVTVNFDIVVAVNKTTNSVRASIEDTLGVHIAGIIDNELDEDIDIEAITYDRIEILSDLPQGWEPFMPPYHRYAQDPDDLRNLSVQQILESNRTEEALSQDVTLPKSALSALWDRVAALEKEIVQLKAKK